jgi:diguanylate cyclase
MKNKYDFRILVIDDNVEIHGDFIKILTNDKKSAQMDSLRQGIFGNDTKETVIMPEFNIDLASDGASGVKKVSDSVKEKKHFALAFVDIRMPPGLDGVETAQKIWELDKDIQIVICTAYSDYSWEETISKLGKTDKLFIIKKPFDVTAVRQLACALTKKWLLSQEEKHNTLSLIAGRKRLEKQLQHKATHDNLTDLPNRIYLEAALSNLINTNKNSEIIAVTIFNLDRFKLINDSLSHVVGDELLQSIAKRLQNLVSESSFVGRIESDEFVIIFNVGEENNDIEIRVKKLLDAIRKPYTLRDREVIITASAGISLYPENGQTAVVLLQNANVAMRRAKDAGGNQLQFYNNEFNQKSLELLEKEMQLRHAIANNEFFLTYQPQIDLKTNKLEAVEVLVRWQHPSIGLVPPNEFIPLAEKTGLIIMIDDWVLETACKQNKSWQDAGFSPIRVAVNVSSKQLNQVNFSKKVINILNATRLAPQYLELEITENSIINNIDVINSINELKQLGIQISLDDFGTGNSCLNYLRDIQVDRLKIDRSFVKNISINHGDEVIIQTLITLANSLGLKVIAEGVETKQQLEFLQNHGCEEIQGFYFSKPLTTIELEKVLLNSNEVAISQKAKTG